MTLQETYLSKTREIEILNEVVTCFENAKEDHEAIFKCMNRFSIKFSKMSYNSSQYVSEFAIEALRIVTTLFQEALTSKEPLEIDINKLGPDEKIVYKYQLKKVLISS